MTDYRRSQFCGGYYFFTVVTCRRRRFLVDDLSQRWMLIKKGFTRRYLKAGGHESGQSLSRHRKRERGIWQRRFWEHQIRDEKDLQKHVDYIHYNPAKHGLVQAVEDWPWSTYHKFVRDGFYEHGMLNDYDGDFGEGFAGE